MRQGRSFSGHERHCFFLNTGAGDFADASAVSGLNLPDDGRGVARVDWDGDGDLDLWVSNRSGPQVRYFQNDTRFDHHFLSIRLQGTRSNRDAIGARVTVICAGQEDKPLVRTVRAGDGFLAQSTKWLHFGLGDCDRLARVLVRWPDGSQQELDEVQVDSRIVLTQGNTIASQASHTARSGGREGPTRIPSANAGPSRAMCFSMIPLPVDSYRDLKGTEQPLVRDDDQLVLLNLWASWCAPCIHELEDFESHRRRLAEGGIRVVALSTHQMTNLQGNSDEDAFLKRKGKSWSFSLGLATESIVERLQLLNNTVFDLHQPLGLPTSFLLDKKRRVCAIYKGPVSAGMLLADAKKLRAQSTNEWRAATVPFPGKWIMPPRGRQLFPLAYRLAQRSYVKESSEYIQAFPRMMISHPHWDRLATELGSQYTRAGDRRSAAHYYKEAVRAAPNNLDALVGLVGLELGHDEQRPRNIDQARIWANRATRASGGNNPNVMLAVAKVQVASNAHKEARQTMRRALSLAARRGQKDLCRQIESELARIASDSDDGRPR